MSFPISAFKDQEGMINHVLEMSGINHSVALTTNKRVIICVLTKEDAEYLKQEFIRNGFFTQYSKGLKTTRRYVAVYFNYPNGY